MPEQPAIFRDLEPILIDYFATEGPHLDELYNWNIPEIVPFGLFKRQTDSCARANMRLRRFLAEAWRNKAAQRIEIAQWYVSVWGGIRANKNGTIAKYVSLPETELAASGPQGVATWSKILAVRNPDTYPIYDARVCASLSAVQFINRIESPILFPQVPSRNSKIIGFQEWINRKPSGSVTKVRRHRAYGDYVSLLSTVAKKSGLTSPEEVEMVLFANAETLVDQILNSSVRNGPP